MNETRVVEFVDYKDSLLAKVGEFLLSRGFDLASSIGCAESGLVPYALGILRQNIEVGVKTRTYLFGLIKIKQKPQRRMFLGTIWFNHPPRGATEQNWIFDVYGREHIESFRQMASEMMSVFDVKISLHLVSEQPKSERYLSDFGD